MAVRVEIESESGILGRPARVRIYSGEKLVTTVIAKMEYQKGADGGQYPCVTLQQQ